MALGPGRMTVALTAALALHLGAALLLMREPEMEGAAEPGSGGLGFGVATLGGSETTALDAADPVEDDAPPDTTEIVEETTEPVLAQETPDTPEEIAPEEIVEAPPEPVEALEEPAPRAEDTPPEPVEPLPPETPEIVEATPVETPPETIPEQPPEPEVATEAPAPPETVTAVAPSSPDASPAPPRRPAAVPPPKPVRRAQTQGQSRRPARQAPAQARPAAGSGDQGGAGQAQAGGGDPAARRGYLAQIHARIARYKRYPNAARIRRQEGEGVLRLTVNASGAVVNVRLRRSTGHKALDDEILRMAARAAPFPRFPDTMGAPSVTVDIPVPFRLR